MEPQHLQPLKLFTDDLKNSIYTITTATLTPSPHHPTPTHSREMSVLEEFVAIASSSFSNQFQC